MQLRVARLCLDCEELHVDSHCPVCASERYQFLSTWLPSEERRRWRRPAPKNVQGARGYYQTLKRRIDRWFGDEEDVQDDAPVVVKTRASDAVPSLDFEPTDNESQPKAARERQPIKGDVR